jgi:predicted anti-sigma-YlaC factor YlaD
MTHKNEDELLAYALEVVAGDEERASTEAHLAVCADCRARLEAIKADIETIGGVRPCVEPRPRLHPSAVQPLEPRAHPFPLYAGLRAAALVAAGILVGFGAASRVHREPVFVSPAYVEVSPPAASSQASSVSDATEVPVGYYDQVLNKTE